MTRALAAIILGIACRTASAPEAPIVNVPSTSADAFATAVVGEYVTVRVAGVPVYGARGGPPLALVDPPESTAWVFTLPVLEVVPDAIRVRLAFDEEELWLWIDAATAYPVIRAPQPIARTEATPAPTDAGIWVTPGVPIEVRGPTAAPWIAVGYPPPDTAGAGDFSLRFRGFVERGTIGRSFVPDATTPRFPAWAKRIVDGGIDAEVRGEVTLLDRPGGAAIATVAPVMQLDVTVLEVRDGHRRIAIDTGELGAVGWISEEAFVITPPDVQAFMLQRRGGTPIPPGTCLFDDAGEPLGRVTTAAVPELDDHHRYTLPTPWGRVQVHLEPAPGGWRTCGEALTSGG